VLKDAWQEWYKIDRFNFLDLKTDLCPGDPFQDLSPSLTHWNHHHAPTGHLGKKAFRDLAGGSRGQNSVIGCVFIPAPAAVTVLQSNIPQIKIL
jgi:hypothetical protein